MHRGWSIALGLALLVAAAPALAAGPKDIVTTVNVTGDVYVMKVRVTPDSAQGFHLLSNSSIRITNGDYPAARDESGLMVGFTDGFQYTRGFATYADGMDDSEMHIEVLTSESLGQQVDRSTPAGFDPTSATFSFTVKQWFPNQADFYVWVAAPEVLSMKVDFDLHFDKPVTVVNTASDRTGLLAAQEDFDGLAQITRSKYTVGTAMETTAQAPPGTQAFSILFAKWDSVGVGHVRIEGPGVAREGMQVGLGNGEQFPLVSVANGGPGTYRHQVTAMVQSGELAPSGYAAMFTAVPMPLSG